MWNMEFERESIMTEIQRVTIIVHGRVHGVFFRDTTMRKARELGLAGDVRNLPEGTVQIVAQGTRPSLDDLIRWAHEGSPASVVSKVEVSFESPKPGFIDFMVEY